MNMSNSIGLGTVVNIVVGNWLKARVRKSFRMSKFGPLTRVPALRSKWNIPSMPPLQD